nr:SDR family NAD(P)-dependent oxidoreductase [Bacteroidota bacterium]
MKKKLEDKTVLITGCLSAVGKACALAAIKEGANVIVADVPSDNSEMVMEEIKMENSNALFIPCDVSKFEDVQRTIEKIISTFRTIDVALNNSAIMCDINESENMSKKDWLKIIGINLNGVFN